MADLSYNLTDDVKNNETFDMCTTKIYAMAIITTDLCTVLIGQPVIAKLLWIAFHAKKTDILNINLAFFNNLQYFLSFIHLCLIFLAREKHIQFARFLFVYVIIGGPMTLAFICLERYIAVVHPTVYPLLKVYRCREVCALSVWLVALPPAIVNGLYAERNVSISLAIDAVAYTIFIMMLTVMAWCNFALLTALRKSGPATDKLHPAKKRAFQTVWTIAIIASLCYIPVDACVFYHLLNGGRSFCETVPVVLFLLSVASVVHPILYLSTTGKLKMPKNVTDNIRRIFTIA